MTKPKGLVIKPAKLKKDFNQLVPFITNFPKTLEQSQTGKTYKVEAKKITATKNI